MWGGICGTIPDLDVVANLFLDPVQANLLHRSFSHSIVFFLLMSPLLGWLIKRIYPDGPSKWTWTTLAFWALLTHALLDCFTTWGTQLFWPLSYRVAFKSIFVIDPLYTAPLFALLLWALFKSRGAERTRLNQLGLTISTAYLVITLLNKTFVDHAFESSFESNGIDVIRYETKPAPLNNILWATTVETDQEYLINYFSLLDDEVSSTFQHYSKNHELLGELAGHPTVKKLIRLSEGWYSIELTNDGSFIFNDLRFGTNRAWEPGGQFVFSYHILPTATGEVFVTEQGRKFDQKPVEILRSLGRRILSIE